MHDSFVFTWIRKRRRRKGRKRRRKRRRERRGRLTMMASQMREMRTLVELLINKTPTTRAGLTRKGGALGNTIENNLCLLYCTLLNMFMLY